MENLTMNTYIPTSDQEYLMSWLKFNKTDVEVLWADKYNIYLEKQTKNFSVILFIILLILWVLPWIIYLLYCIFNPVKKHKISIQLNNEWKVLNYPRILWSFYFREFNKSIK